MNINTILRELFSLIPPKGLAAPKISPAYHESSLAFLESIHRGKSELLKDVIAVEGWPDSSKESDKAQAAAFTVALHADYDVEFQKLCHGLMVASAVKGHTPLGFIAFLTDRILCNEGHHQRFGTQIREVPNGSFVPKPIEDSDIVDELREKVGLGETLADYFQRVNDGDLLLYRLLVDAADHAPAPPIGSNILPFPTKH